MLFLGSKWGAFGLHKKSAKFRGRCIVDPEVYRKMGDIAEYIFDYLEMM